MDFIFKYLNFSIFDLVKNNGQTAVDAITNHETVATKLEEAIALSTESNNVLEQANVSKNAVHKNWDHEVFVQRTWIKQINQFYDVDWCIT